MYKYGLILIIMTVSLQGSQQPSVSNNNQRALLLRKYRDLSEELQKTSELTNHLAQRFEQLNAKLVEHGLRAEATALDTHYSNLAFPYYTRMVERDNDPFRRGIGRIKLGELYLFKKNSPAQARALIEPLTRQTDYEDLQIDAEHFLAIIAEFEERERQQAEEERRAKEGRN